MLMSVRVSRVHGVAPEYWLIEAKRAERAVVGRRYPTTPGLHAMGMNRIEVRRRSLEEQKGQGVIQTDPPSKQMNGFVSDVATSYR